MDSRKFSWEDIDKLEDHHITYLLYKEGKTVDSIALIRKMTKTEVENHIIRAKIEIKPEDNIKNDFLLDIMSMNKNDRLKSLKELDYDKREQLINDITKRYIKFKNPEDRMIIIWLMGELKDKRFLPYLKMELKSNNINYRRLACSALGKIGERTAKSWLEDMLNDTNPQVRQYAINALSQMGDKDTIDKLKSLLNNKKEKNYVKRAILKAIESIS